MVPNSRKTGKAPGVQLITFLHGGAVFVFIGIGIYVGFEFAFSDCRISAGSTRCSLNEYFIY